MKKLIMATLGASLLSALVTFNVSAGGLPEGQVDFGEFKAPGSGGQFVEVNVSSSLISLVSRFLEKDQPDVAKLLNGLQAVRVNVIGMDEQNRGELQQRAQKIRKELDGKGWERIVTAQKSDQDVSVYLKTKNKDTVQGLAVVVIEENKQAVFVNVVGEIRPEQLSMLGEKLHIQPLEQFGHSTEK